MISVWNNQKALLLRTDEPAAALLFDNRPMGYAISKYLETLQQKAMAGRYHREKVISGLKKYLNESPL